MDLKRKDFIRPSPATSDGLLWQDISVAPVIPVFFNYHPACFIAYQNLIHIIPPAQSSCFASAG
jgi:hypothetical protein